MFYVITAPIGQSLQTFWQKIAACGAAGVTFLLLTGQTALADPAQIFGSAEEDATPILILISPVAGIEFESTPAGPDDVLARLRRGWTISIACLREPSATFRISSQSSNGVTCRLNLRCCLSLRVPTTHLRIRMVVRPVSGK